MAYFTISGGTHCSEVDLTNYDGVIVKGIGGTVDSWKGVGDGKSVTIKNNATLTAGAWNSNLAVTVDMTGSSATGGNAWKAIDYTGTGTVSYGFITLTGTKAADRAGGSRVNGASFTEDTNSWLKQSVDSVALNVTGGTFFERASVFAGGYLVGKQDKDVQLEITNGVNVTLNADILTDTKYGSVGVYGGALASNYGTASIGKGTSAYAVQITVEDGHYSAIYGGGWAESNANSQVSGGVSIKVTGGSIGNLFAGGNNDTSGATANVTDGGAIITLEGGTVNNLYASSKWTTSKIDGNTEVNVTGGTITRMLSGWTPNGRDAVTGTQTLDLDASISCNEVLGFDVWEVAENATLTAAEEIDLKDVTLDFGSATSGWDIATAEAGITNLDEATIILTGVTSWTFENSCWTSNDKQWTLSVDKTGKTLTLAKA